MATKPKPKPVIFKITDEGRLAVLDAQKQGLKLSLKTLAVGTSQYMASGKETRLKSEAMRVDIVTSGIEKESKSLRFSASLNSPTLKTIHEIGLFTSDNKLFAIAASNDPLFTIYANVTFVGSFGLSLDGFDVDKITVSTDPDGMISLQLMEDHLAAENPHPQYVGGEKFEGLNKKVDKLGQNISSVSGDLSAHIKNPDPHPQYTLKTDHDAHIKQYGNLQKEVQQNSQNITQNANKISNHEKAADPHTQYAKKTDLDSHTKAADPHSQYLKDSDLAEMRKQIEDLQKKLTKAESNVTELPIGSVYTTTTNYKSSAEVKAALGYGTWARFAEGQTLVGVSTKAGDPAWTKTIKNEFGEYEHKLTLDEMPKHTHDLNFVVNNIRGNTRPATQSTSSSPSNMNATDAGGDKPHNNVQPSTVVAHWVRTA